MAERNIKWYKLANSVDEIAWQTNNLAIAEANGRKITLVRTDKNILACAYKCPHAGGILANGFIDATGNIVCPLHRYKFSPDTGRNISGEGYYLTVYTVEVSDNGIFVGFEDRNWLNIFQ